MSINFCCHGLIRNILCDKSSFDGHDVSALIARRGILLKKGFIADYFVKPPVMITLEFICHVDISHILVKSFVGSQRSVSFELYARSSAHGIGKISAAYDLKNADFVVFHKYGDSRFSGECAHIPSRTNIPFHSLRRLKDVYRLELKITKTSNSSVPCLGQLEVWGEPSTSAPDGIIIQVNKKWKQFSEPLQVETPSESNNNSDCSSSLSNVVDIISEGFPEEFTDPITCNIMLCPMILPCGKVVDQSTLDKFYAVEEKWGRGHSDPFTGLPFSDLRKPILDFVLKAKIDKYLVFHSESDLVKNIPRIIGRKPMSSVPGVSQPCHSSQLDVVPSNNKNNSLVSFSKTKDISQLNPAKRVKRSLDELIAESLNGLPSYLESSKHQVLPKEECVLCKEASCLFKIPCSHLICRSCLLKFPNDGNYVCAVCRKSFKSSDPVRYHNPSV